MNYRIKGNLKLAEKYFKENINTLKENYGTTHSYYTTALNNLASLYYSTDNYKKANTYYQQYSSNFKAQIQSNFTFLSEKEKFQHLKKNTYSLKTYQNFVFDYHKKLPKVTAELFNNLLFHKKLILLNTRSFQQFIENSNDTALQNTYDKLRFKKQKIADYYSQASIKPEDYKKLQTQAEELEKKLLRLSNANYPNKKLKNIDTKTSTYKELQKTLKKNEAIIEFTHFKRLNKQNWTDTTYYCALILRKDYKCPKLVFLSTEKKLQKILKRGSFQSDDIDYITNLYQHNKQGNAKGDKLYNLIWSEINPLLSGVKNVYISPTGLLHSISFSALPVGESLLKDKYQLNYLTSSKNILNKKSLYFKTIQTASLFGGIDYETDSLTLVKIAKKYKKQNFISTLSAFSYENEKIILIPLPETKTEIKSIEQLLLKNNKKVSVFTDSLASEEAFKNLSNKKVDLIHIATHGYYFSQKEAQNKENNLFNISETTQTIDNSLFRSGLYFAGAQASINGRKATTDYDDGILTSYEISSNNLENTSLVVLSACQTGLGDVKGNEGIVGLSRAFKTVGIDYLILSLWEVPSFQTIELMDLFYKHFVAGKNIETAFAEAQHEMAKKSKNPYFWAGFILIN